jgi:hypothetical protein
VTVPQLLESENGTLLINPEQEFVSNTHPSRKQKDFFMLRSAQHEVVYLNMGKRYNTTVLLVIVVFLLLIGSAFVFSANNPSRIVNDPTPTIVSEKEPAENDKTQNEKVTYEGEDGMDALTLLKKIASVEQDSSGLVTGINGRNADSKKKEFWGFYINGKMSEVGPAEYQTKNEDTMEWKIETY